MFPKTLAPSSFIGISFVLHVTVAAALLWGIPKKVHLVPIEISFSESGQKIGHGGGGKKGAGTPQKITTSQVAKPQVITPKSLPKVVAAAPDDVVKPQSLAPAASPQNQVAASTADATNTSDQAGNGFGVGEGIGNGSGGENGPRAKYNSQVAKLIDAAKKYPAMARRLGQEGRVVVMLKLDKNGKLLELEVVEKSRFTSLTTATIDTIKNVGTFPKIPVELGLNEISLRVPLEYKQL